MVEQITADEAVREPNLIRWVGWWRVRVPRRYRNYRGELTTEWLPLFYAPSEEKARSHLAKYKSRWFN